MIFFFSFLILRLHISWFKKNNNVSSFKNEEQNSELLNFKTQKNTDCTERKSQVISQEEGLRKVEQSILAALQSFSAANVVVAQKNPCVIKYWKYKSKKISCKLLQYYSIITHTQILILVLEP